MYSGTEGVISHLDYDNDETIQWNIRAECDQVHISSTQFRTELDRDIVRINNVPYSGSVGMTSTGNYNLNGFLTVVDQLVPGHSAVSFASNGITTDSGFVLEWQCKPGKIIF